MTIDRVAELSERRDGAAAPAVLWTANGVAVAIADIPRQTPTVFQRTCIETCRTGARLSALAVVPVGGASARPAHDLVAVLADDAGGRLGLVRGAIPAEGYPALTPALPQAQAFERAIFEEHGIRPQGHPWLKPLRRHRDLDARAKGRWAELDSHARAALSYPFFRVEGEGVHEVSVGPVHAGIIEPGQFRFQCLGEEVMSLEIQLGYQHRGARALLLRSAPARRLLIAETLAGDTSVGHATAYARAVEALSGTDLPLGAQAIRGIALELERIANHVGDLGALAGDVGFLPSSSWFGRLRGDFLNMTAEICGSRFGRGLVRVGGVRFAISSELRKELLGRLVVLERDLGDTAGVLFDSASVSTRFEHTGVVRAEMAETLGLVGPAARASGADRDVRRDHPFGIYRYAHLPVATVPSGDVMGRALVRWLEVQRSLTFVREQLSELGDGPTGVTGAGAPRASALVVSLVEGWRGEIAHIAVTDAAGELAGYEIVDPSMHNWFGLAMALRGQQISDFPLCNKSFNLSYAGHDL